MKRVIKRIVKFWDKFFNPFPQWRVIYTDDVPWKKYNGKTHSELMSYEHAKEYCWLFGGDIVWNREYKQ